MPHLIQPLEKNVSFCEGLRSLRESHDFVIQRAAMAMQESNSEPSHWGISLKRIQVNLAGEDRPALIGKLSEKFAEVINIAATVERLIAAIEWFATKEPGWRIHECHPSTSDEADGNDLVLIDNLGVITARCEVCDVVSSRASVNGKEKKDIRNLGCTSNVPDDNVQRYICTAPEFARALTSQKRKWATMPYVYETIAIGDSTQSQLLRIKPNDKIAPGAAL